MTLVLLVTAGTALAQADDLKPYPPAEAGTRRVVIRLPAVTTPDDRRVEVIVGRTMVVDCNRHQFSAQVTRRVAPGWGYPYYVVGELHGPVSTRMACPPDFVPRREFVPVAAHELAWLPYNARLPIVLYVGADSEVRYRVWSAGQMVESRASE